MVFVNFFFSALVGVSFANPLIPLGGPAWCWSGGGAPDHQVTKDCCAAVTHKAYFNGYYKTCTAHGGQIDNAVDHGAFARCCDSRGRGAHGCKPQLNDINAGKCPDE